MMLPKLKEKYDYRQTLKAYYAPKNPLPHLVTVPPMHFISIEGQGSPNNNPVFEAAVSALYGCAFSIKFARKKAGIEPEYSVQPMEGLWWVEGTDPAQYLQTPQSEWHWLLLLGQPDFITTEEFEAAQEILLQKNVTAAAGLRLELYNEGLCVQTLYVGPYKDEHPTITSMHQWAIEQGYELHGLHHEIYLSDPRRTPAEKLKTILRMPLVKAG